jgi:hypothetical protein
MQRKGRCFIAMFFEQSRSQLRLSEWRGRLLLGGYFQAGLSAVKGVQRSIDVD